MADAQYMTPLRRPTTCYWCQERIPAGAMGYMVTANTWTHPECAEAWGRDPCREEGECGPGHGTKGHTCQEGALHG